MTAIKRKTLAVLLIVVLALTSVALGCQSPVAGDPAPDTIAETAELVPNIVGETFKHGTFNLHESIGRPAVINFWYPSCHPCIDELPDLQSAYRIYKDEVDFVGVFLPNPLNTEQQARALVTTLGVDYPNLTSTSVPLDYSIPTYPTTIFLSADHTQRNNYFGGPIDSTTLFESIEQLLNDS